MSHRSLIPVAFIDCESEHASPESGRTHHVFHDGAGMPHHIESASGQVVWRALEIDAYGSVIVDPKSTIDYHLRWPGHRFDQDTGLHYNRYRDYDPQLGRYIEPDPLGHAGGINLYAYCRDPIGDVDLLGLHPQNKANGTEGETGRPTAEGAPDRTDPHGTHRNAAGRLVDARGRFANDPHASGGDYTPDVFASKERNTDMNSAALDPADLEVNQRLRERDAELTTRNQLENAGDQDGAASAEARANKATEHLGNLATDAAVARAYPGARLVHRGEGPGTFDRVYATAKPPPAYVVGEGKGGTARNSSSRRGPDGRRYQQGTPEYRDIITNRMAESSDPATQDVGGQLLDAGDDVDYVEVRQPMNTRTGPDGRATTTLGTIQGNTYSPKRRDPGEDP